MTSNLSPQAQLRIEYRATTSLTPYAHNARKHPRSQIKKIAASLNAFGWTNPIIIDAAGGILCGHGRYEAALLLKLPAVPTITLAHLNEADRRAYILADNAIAEKSGWQKETLISELRGLAEIGYDVELTGFDTIQIDTLLAIGDPEEVSDDRVELPPDGYKPVCRIGDLWEIGEHRLIVGDARDRSVYERLLSEERVQLIVSDPPYGCVIENNVSGGGRIKHGNFIMGAGETSLPDFAMTLLRPAFKCMAACCLPGCIAFIFTDWRAAPHLLDAAEGELMPQAPGSSRAAAWPRQLALTRVATRASAGPAGNLPVLSPPADATVRCWSRTGRPASRPSNQERWMARLPAPPAGAK